MEVQNFFGGKNNLWKLTGEVMKMKKNRKKAKPIGDYPLYWQVFLLTLIVLYGSSFVLLLMGLISV
jgi:hypothetical protein